MAEKEKDMGDGQTYPKVSPTERFRRALVTVVLTLQVSTMVITLRYSKTSTHYLNGTAVLLAEALKMLICLMVLLAQHGSRLGEHLMLEVVRKPQDLGLVSVPALLYLLQNNLLFFAMEHLEAVIYQVTYQLKILITAICMVLMLGKKLTCQQWCSLILLASGVALAQGGERKSKPSEAKLTSLEASSQLIGFLALIVACITSGFAGVYTEKLLKQSNVSLWVRNLQLCLWSLVVGAATLAKDWDAIQEKGFFQGYTWVVWCVVLLQAASGILVALVMKLADNIVKSFSAAMSLLLSTVISIPVFGFQPTWHFAAGACMVLWSAHLYSGGALPWPLSELRWPQSHQKPHEEEDKVTKGAIRMSVISEKV